jgi:hypothetical protein
VAPWTCFISPATSAARRGPSNTISLAGEEGLHHHRADRGRERRHVLQPLPFRPRIESEFYDFKPTITKVYAQGNPLALREWHWDDYKTIPGVNDDYHNAFDKYENYMELSAKKRKKRKIEDERLTEVRSPILNKHK